MSEWWNSIESMVTINGYAAVLTLLFAAVTVLLVILARLFFGRASDAEMSYDDMAELEVASLKRTVSDMRKELLEAKQGRDVTEQLLKSAETDIQKLKGKVAQHRNRATPSEPVVSNQDDNHKQAREAAEVVSDQAVNLKNESSSALTVSQRHQLQDLLEPGPKGNIDIVSMLGNDISARMAHELDDILTENGWITTGVSASAFSSPPKGIVVAVHSKETAPTYAVFLQRTLAVIGLPVSGGVKRKVREWSLMLVVGDVSPS